MSRNHLRKGVVSLLSLGFLFAIQLGAIETRGDKSTEDEVSALYEIGQEIKGKIQTPTMSSEMAEEEIARKLLSKGYAIQAVKDVASFSGGVQVASSLVAESMVGYYLYHSNKRLSVAWSDYLRGLFRHSPYVEFLFMLEQTHRLPVFIDLLKNVEKQSSPELEIHLVLKFLEGKLTEGGQIPQTLSQIEALAPEHSFEKSIIKDIFSRFESKELDLKQVTRSLDESPLSAIALISNRDLSSLFKAYEIGRIQQVSLRFMEYEKAVYFYGEFLRREAEKKGVPRAGSFLGDPADNASLYRLMEAGPVTLQTKIASFGEIPIFDPRMEAITHVSTLSKEKKMRVEVVDATGIKRSGGKNVSEESLIEDMRIAYEALWQEAESLKLELENRNLKIGLKPPTLTWSQIEFEIHHSTKPLEKNGEEVAVERGHELLQRSHQEATAFRSQMEGIVRQAKVEGVSLKVKPGKIAFSQAEFSRPNFFASSKYPRLMGGGSLALGGAVAVGIPLALAYESGRYREAIERDTRLRLLQEQESKSFMTYERSAQEDLKNILEGLSESKETFQGGKDQPQKYLGFDCPLKSLPWGHPNPDIDVVTRARTLAGMVPGERLGAINSSQLLYFKMIAAVLAIKDAEDKTSWFDFFFEKQGDETGNPYPNIQYLLDWADKAVKNSYSVSSPSSDSE